MGDAEATQFLTMLANDTLRATYAGRIAQRARVVSELGARLRERPAAEWLDRLAAAGVPCGVVRSVLEVLEDTEASARTGMPPSVPGLVRREPPRLGQHSDAVRVFKWGAFSQV